MAKPLNAMEGVSLYQSAQMPTPMPYVRKPEYKTVCNTGHNGDEHAFLQEGRVQLLLGSNCITVHKIHSLLFSQSICPWPLRMPLRCAAPQEDASRCNLKARSKASGMERSTG